MSADLRTDLTKLADKWNNQAGARDPEEELRALLAAHPAPETAGHVCTPHCDAERGHYPAPVSDTRREDVEVLRGRHGAMTWEEDNYAAGWEHALDAVLAVLAAPPVVDEAEILDCMTTTWAAHIGVGDPVTPLPVHRHMAAAVAARLRGATR